MKSSLADTPAPGSTHLLKRGDSLQAALDSAKCGDTISLEAGGTSTAGSSCRLRVATTSIGSSSAPVLPTARCLRKALGSRPASQGSPPFRGGGPSSAQPLATSWQRSSSPVAALPSLWRTEPTTIASSVFEITRPASKGTVYNLVVNQSAAPSTTLFRSPVASRTAQDETTRGLMLTGSTYVAWWIPPFSDFHCVAVTGTCSDSQAIGRDRRSGHGTLQDRQQLPRSRGENIIFGGGEATRTPEDVEIRRNFFFKPLIWMRGQPGFVGDGTAIHLSLRTIRTEECDSGPV